MSGTKCNVISGFYCTWIKTRTNSRARMNPIESGPWVRIPRCRSGTRGPRCATRAPRPSRSRTRTLKTGGRPSPSSRGTLPPAAGESIHVCYCSLIFWQCQCLRPRMRSNIQGCEMPCPRKPGLGWLWFLWSTNLPSCLAASAKFQSAQAESGREWNTQNPSPQNPVYEDMVHPV